MTDVATEERGEDELELAGSSYLLRPSRKAISAIERKLGLSLLAIVRLGNSGELTTDHLGEIACRLIREGAADDLTRSVDPDRLADLIYEEGVALATARLTFVLAGAVTGGRTASGEPKATTA